MGSDIGYFITWVWLSKRHDYLFASVGTVIPDVEVYQQVSDSLLACVRINKI